VIDDFHGRNVLGGQLAWVWDQGKEKGRGLRQQTSV
jgi:hypothetical protein